MQANNAAFINKSVVYSSFSITGSATAPFSGGTTDNFMSETTLNTNWWDISESTAPDVLVVPASAKYWINWTLPAGGFSLEVGTNLNSLVTWSSPTMYPVLPFSASLGQLVDSTELPAGKTAYFNLIKRVASQLQILLPGETAAPGTITGKTGTPSTVTLSSGGLETVIVNAVDSTWHIVSGVGGAVHLTTTDTGPNGAALPIDENMINGVATFDATNPLGFEDVGTWTITATNTANSFPAVTSAPVNVTN